MNKKNLHVLSNIIAAVESGGQIYSENRDWTAYAGAYANTPGEHTCTLGPYQAYGDEAQELIQYIWDHHETAFRECDPNMIIYRKLFDGQSTSWVEMRWNPNSTEKAILIKLLGTEAGHEASEYVFQERLNKYITRAEKFGVKTTYGQMMWAQIQHLGGVGPVTRVFNRCNGNYSLDSIMSALMADQADSSSSNQVGDKIYWSRHQKCVEFIRKYAEEEYGGVEKKEEGETMSQLQKGLNLLGQWVKEGHVEPNGDDDIIKAYNDQRPAGTYKMSMSDSWCMASQSVMAHIVGLNPTGKAVGAPNTCDCDVGMQWFKNQGRWYSRMQGQLGDQVYYTWHNDPSDAQHVGTITAIEGSYYYVTEGNYQDRVAVRKIAKSDSRIIGVGRPKWDSTEVENETAPTLDNPASKDNALQGKYTVKEDLNIRYGAGTDKTRIGTLTGGAEVTCDGSYTDVGDKKWYYVKSSLGYGFVSGAYLTKIVELPKVSDITVATFIGAIDAVYQTAHKGNYSYGNSLATPPTSDKIISCDRLIAKAMYDLGFTDQPKGGITVGHMETYLTKWVLKNVTDQSKIKGGDIILFKADGTAQPTAAWHAFVVTDYDHVTKTCSKYDMGSQDRINSAQPFTNVDFDQWLAKSFYCAFTGFKEEPKEEPKQSSGKLNESPKWVAKATTGCNVRVYAGTEYPNIKSYPQLAKGNLVDVCDSVKAKNGVIWYYVRIKANDKYVHGFVSSKCLARV